MRAGVIALALGLAACASCGREEPGSRDPAFLYLLPVDPSLSVPSEAEAGAVARVEIAADVASRGRGLMYREELPRDTGMLFIYPWESPREFWMKNTKIPLSIAFFTAAGRIVRILDMEPGWERDERTLPRYRSGVPAQYALEMRQGWFRDNRVREGHRVRLHPRLAETRAR